MVLGTTNRFQIIIMNNKCGKKCKKKKKSFNIMQSTKANREVTIINRFGTFSDTEAKMQNINNQGDN